MKKLLLSIFALGGFVLSAQDLPQPSPSASVDQRVGLTDFSVEYSRPAMRGRTIFGDLVPYDQLWRTGANKATSIEFNTPVNIEGESIPAGKYSIFTIPGEGEWVFILNSNTELWGTDGYQEEKDVFRASFEAMEMSKTENFTINFDGIDGGKAKLNIYWADRGISVPISVDVKAKALENIKNALANSEEENLWRVNRNAATYYARNNMDSKEALKFIEKSIELNPENWYSHFVHGEILAANGDNKAAVKAGKKALKLGQEAADEAGQKFGYASMIEEGIAKWKD